MNILTQLGTAESPSGGLLGALGIDWAALIFQIIAFLILTWFLGKFVYPVLMKTVDARRADAEASSKAVVEAQKKAEQAEKDIEKLLSTARKEASEIVTTARAEANAAIERADSKAKSRADAIVASAQEQIAKEVIAAEKVLHNETLDLVVQATEQVIGKTVDAKLDTKVVAAAIAEAR